MLEMMTLRGRSGFEEKSCRVQTGGRNPLSLNREGEQTKKVVFGADVMMGDEMCLAEEESRWLRARCRRWSGEDPPPGRPLAPGAAKRGVRFRQLHFGLVKK